MLLALKPGRRERTVFTPIETTFRDFSETHSDFEDCFGEVDEELVESELVGGKPVPLNPKDCQQIHEWYVDSVDNVTVVRDTMFYQNDSGAFANRYLEDGTRWRASSMEFVALNIEECEVPCQPCYFNQAAGCVPGELMDGSPLFFPLDGIEGALDGGGGYEAQVAGPPY